MKSVLMPWTLLPELARTCLNAFESLLTGGWKSLVIVMIGLIIAWHIYVPIHELLHVAACLMTGGEVESLALQPRYGGTLLQPIFPFIVPDSEYAGQLTGFTVPNHLAYAFVDLLPYLPSLFGLTLVVYTQRKRLPWLFGAAVILTLIPLMSIPGDYYEAASLVTTRIAESIDPTLPSGVLISDDAFRSIGVLRESGHLTGATGSLVGVGLLAATLGAVLTLAVQVPIAHKLIGTAPPTTEPVPAGDPAPSR